MWRLKGGPAVCAGVAALVLGCHGFSCPPVNYQDKTSTVSLANGRVFIPIYLHQPRVRKNIELAVIALHGAGRNGDNYFGWVTNAMYKQGLEDNVVVITPVFADKSCTAAQWLGDEGAEGRSVKWSRSTRQWVFGQTSDGFGDWSGISSYQAIDDLVEYAENEYKSIKRVVVTGFSAGAQMGLRWSIVSLQGVHGTTLGGRKLTIMLGSPSSVTYLDEQRPSKQCSAEGATPDDHNCTDFVVPSKKTKMKTCRGKFHRYPFGTAGLNAAGPNRAKKDTTRGDVSEYVHKFIEDDTLLQPILLEHWATKDVVFQFGDKDTKDCKIGACAKDCEAMLQGRNRLQRGLNFMYYLEATIPGYKAEYSTFHGGHRPELFFSGDMFNKKAFNKEGWDECLWDSLACFSLLWQIIVLSVFALILIVGLTVFICRHGSASAKKREDHAPFLAGGGGYASCKGSNA